MLTVLGGRAKARGVHMGRPPKLTRHQREEALRDLAKGKATQTDIARRFNVSRRTISRYPEEPLLIKDFLPQDMREQLQKIRQRSKELVASFVGKIDSSPPPPLIYHYTNDAGLRGILETGKIWLTDIRNLNDPSN